MICIRRWKCCWAPPASSPPDIDHYLAERFVSQMERQRAVLPARRFPSPRLGHHAAAIVLVIAVLAVGGPLTILQHTTPSATSCLPRIVKDYQTSQAAIRDLLQVEATGYRKSASRRLPSGAVIVMYVRSGSCNA